MNSDSLDKAFEQAVESINSHHEPFPADFLLRLYALYKRATNNREPSKGSKPLINAFKANALFQARNIDTEEAKRLYIEAVDHYFLYRN